MTIIRKIVHKKPRKIRITQDVLTREYGAYVGAIPPSCKILIDGIHPTAVENVLKKLNENPRLTEINKPDRWWEKILEK